jgi:hypothetical protein
MICPKDRRYFANSERDVMAFGSTCRALIASYRLEYVSTLGVGKPVKQVAPADVFLTLIFARFGPLLESIT